VTVLEQLGAHAATGYSEGLSGPGREAVRLHLADTVGAWIAAGATAEGRALLRFLSPEEKDIPGRVGLNCALARLSEADDIHLASGTTPGAIAVPAALTLAAARGPRTSGVAEAIAVGYDLMTRLGAALGGPEILYRGIWPTYFAAPFAVAAVAARLLALSEKEAAHALAIALACSSPSVGRQAGASTSRWLALGNAARSGVAAALAAQAGFTGDLRLFEGEFFSGAYRIAPGLDALTEAAEPAAARTSFKPWCAARQTMAATEALREIIEEGVPPSAMASLSVGVPPLTVKMIDHGVVPGERSSYLTSVPYQMALAAFAPDASRDVSHAPEAVSGEIGGFMARVSVSPDEDLLRHYPRSWPARLVVATPGGKREKLVLHVPGDPERPFDELQVAAKFWRLTAPVVGESAAEELLRLSFAALYGERGPRALLDAIEGALA
jgi:2-methylcitrate dehydratase PrpD